MRDEIANLVFPVFAHGVELKARLEAGSWPDLELEQMELKRLLGSDVEARRLSDYGGDSMMGQSVAAPRGGGGTRGSDPFLGIRYALVCWLDELFILDSPWSTEWNERKLEAALYGTNDRAWKFWDQAKRAESQQGSDALEVFFLCVMLGFRGDLREEATRLQAWVAGTQIRVAKSQAQEFTVPPELQPPTNVPPLRGRERLQRMVLVAGIVLLMLIPVATVLLVIRLSSS
jgi:type VI secretion system protein ImpK